MTSKKKKKNFCWSTFGKKEKLERRKSWRESKCIGMCVVLDYLVRPVLVARELLRQSGSILGED